MVGFQTTNNSNSNHTMNNRSSHNSSRSNTNSNSNTNNNSTNSYALKSHTVLYRSNSNRLLRGRKKPSSYCFGPWCATVLLVLVTIVLLVPTLFQTMMQRANLNPVVGSSSSSDTSSSSNSNNNININNNSWNTNSNSGTRGSSSGASSTSTSSIAAKPKHDSKPNTKNAKPMSPSPSLIEGSIGGEIGSTHHGSTQEIAYYHQPATTSTRASTHRHVLLLHGSAFTKENWRSSGILELVGTNFPWLAVTALDLPVSADYRQLVDALEDLRREGIVRSLPVSALVTPSASGKSVTDWINAASSATTKKKNKDNTNSDSGSDDDSDDSSSLTTLTAVPKITDYVRLWVPVASYSVAKSSASQLQAFITTTTTTNVIGGSKTTRTNTKPTTASTTPIQILAVYGDRDKKGKKVSVKLRDQAGAKALRLPGGHPVYLDSPNEFVDALAKEIELLPF